MLENLMIFSIITNVVVLFAVLIMLVIVALHFVWGYIRDKRMDRIQQRINRTYIHDHVNQKEADNELEGN